MKTTFVGICSIDLYAKSSRLPQYGETLQGESLNKGFGGKASNACAQFAFLAEGSTPPQLLTVVGNDSDGQSIQNHFKDICIDTKLIQVSNSVPTGLAICFVLGEKGESAIVIYPCSVTLDMVHQCQSEISSSKFVVTNFEIPVPVAAETLKIAHAGGATTVLNASPLPEAVPDEIFSNCTIVIVNQVELQKLGSVQHLHDLGVECVIITLGPNGASVFEKGQNEQSVPSPSVTAVDTTGAGDSFLGSFVYCLSRGMSRIDAAKIACIAASISVQSVGTQQSYAHHDHPQLISILPK